MKEANQTHKGRFNRWLDEHQGLIFKVVNSYASLPEDQDDLFQEILLQLWRSIPHFHGDAKESTWIYRVALNTALTWDRGKKRKRKKHRQMLLKYIQSGEPHDQQQNPHPDTEIINQVIKAIKQLPKIDRSIILMHLDGLTYEEMAKVTGISQSHVGVRFYRAKKELAQMLKGIIDDF